MATELAKAYVQIVPSAQGMEGAISSVMNGEAKSAGSSNGKNFAAGFGKIAGKAMAAIGIGKIITDGIANTGAFETAMAKTSTLFTGTADEFAELEQRILSVSGETGMAATMLAEAAYSAESASVPAELLGDMIESSAKLAVAGFTDVDTALSATAKTMNAYGMNGADAMEQVQKVLIQTQNYGITTVGELGASLANVTPTAAAMGVSFEQVGASLALMTARGVPTAQATTQLRAAMTELGKSGTTASKSFAAAAEGTEYAGMTFQEAISAGADLGDVFGLMQSYADASGLSMVDLWGSVEAGNAAMMIAADIETFNKDLNAMSENSDVVGDSYGKMAGSFGQSMNRLKESAKNFMITLFSGGDISSSFDTMLSSLGDIGDRLIGWMTTGLGSLGENLPALMSSLLDFGGSLLDALGQVNWIELGTTIVTGIVGAMGELGVRLTETVGNAITAVSNGEVDFGSIGTAIWNGVTSVITVAGDWLQKIFETAASVTAGVDFTGIGSAILSGVTTFIDSAGGFLGTLFGSGRDAAEGVGYTGIGSKILEGVNSSIDAAGTFLSSAFESAKTTSEGLSWSDVGTAVKTGVDLILNGGQFLSSVFSAGAELVKGIDWNGVGSSIGNFVSSGLDNASKMIGVFTEAAEELKSNIDWKAVGSSVTDLVTTGLDSGTKLINTFTTASDNLIKSIDWENVGTNISTLVDTGAQGVSGLLEASFTAAKDLIVGIPWGEVGSAISSGLGDVWEGLTGLVGGVLGGVGDIASGGAEVISSALVTAAARIRGEGSVSEEIEKLKTNFEEMKTAVETGKESAVETAKTVSTAIKNGLASDLSATVMSTLGSSAIGNLIEGIRTGKAADGTSLADAMTTVAGDGKGAMETAGWSGVGAGIITGIISGINLTSGALFERLRQVALSALAAAKSTLAVGSPSRVMRDEVGQWIPAGIAEGIDSGAGMVTDAMTRLTAASLGSNIAGSLASQGQSVGAAAADANESGTAAVVGAIQEMRQDLQNLRIVVGKKTFGRTVVEYSGAQVDDYIGQSDTRLAAGFGT